MAEYYVDKIKYSGNTYKLLDNGALHTNGILTGTTGTFAADKGIFNKLIATSADIDTLDVNNLTATNAKVLGLLDVQGELHTNKWTNANISNIGGSFYISPTVSTTIATGNTPMSITIGGSANARTFAVSGGSFVTDAVKIYNGSTTTTASWAVGSHVMVTGSIRVGTNGVDYPLGTLTGYLTVALATGGFTVGEISSTALETIITEIGTSNLKSYDIKISMFEIGPKTTLKPVGIMMTSYGVDKSTYLDIYGGVNQKNSSTGAVDPNLRIGYLGGLPGFTVNGETTTTPTGWGIYTDNGFFKGTIAATSGLIGGYSIGTDNLIKGAVRDADGSFWLTPAQSSSSPMSELDTAQWAITTGQNFGVTTSGKLYASGAEISGTLIVEPDSDSNIYTSDEINNKLGGYATETQVQQVDNFVKSHIEIDGTTMSIVSNDTMAKLVMSTLGLSLYGSKGTILAEYGEDAIIGDSTKFHVRIVTTSNVDSENGIFFYNGANPVAYISGDRLYITQSVVLQQMDVGEQVANGGLGQWSWKVHEVDNQNNLYLKWLG